MPFYRPEDVYLYLVPLLLGQRDRTGACRATAGGADAGHQRRRYGLLSMLLVGTPLLLWWVLVMVVGWLVARGAELIRRPAVPNSAGSAGL